MTDKDIFNTAEALEHTQLGRVVFTSLVKCGAIPMFNRINGRNYFRKADLDAALKKRHEWTDSNGINRFWEPPIKNVTDALAKMNGWNDKDQSFTIKVKNGKLISKENK